MGIEPTSEAWEASILPLYDARSLLILLHLGCNQSRILFSIIFQSINFGAKLGREFCLHLVERNLPSVACRHRSRRTSHLMADHGRSQTGQFSTTIATRSECVEARALKLQSI